MSECVGSTTPTLRLRKGTAEEFINSQHTLPVLLLRIEMKNRPLLQLLTPCPPHPVPMGRSTYPMCSMCYALQVLQSMKSKERAGMTPVQLRKKAADFARNTVAKQSDSFRRYGVMGDFEKPYLTLQPEYEAAQIEVGGPWMWCMIILARMCKETLSGGRLLAMASIDEEV